MTAHRKTETAGEQTQAPSQNRQWWHADKQAYFLLLFLIRLTIPMLPTYDDYGYYYDGWLAKYTVRRAVLYTYSHNKCVWCMWCVCVCIRTLSINCTTPITVFCALMIGIQSTAFVWFSSSSTGMSGCSAAHFDTSMILNSWLVDATNCAIWASDDVFKSLMVGREIVGVWLSCAMSKINVNRAREF